MHAYTPGRQATHRVPPIVVSRFVRMFKKRCKKLGAQLNPLLLDKLDKLVENPQSSAGILDLRKCRTCVREGVMGTRRLHGNSNNTLWRLMAGLRDTHMIALAFTLKAVPCFGDLRLTGNYITDAGVNALNRTMEWQMQDANFGNGVRPALTRLGAAISHHTLLVCCAGWWCQEVYRGQ